MSFKSEFIEVYNYLSDCCKDPIITTPYVSEDDFDWKDGNPSTGVIIKYKGSAKVVKVPSGVKEIGYRSSDACFRECKEVTTVILPNGLKKIGDFAFYKCTNLVSINIPNGVTSIGSNAFCDCDSLTSIDIPNSVESIGDYTFYRCDTLTSIDIFNGVKSIGLEAFSRCPSLTSINIPNSVTSIGAWAFFKSGLVSINIPDSVTSIGSNAFSYCDNLRSFTCSADLDLSVADVPAGCAIIRR